VPDVRCSEVSGVPVFWTPSARPELIASLRFRTGIADETLPRLGWTRLAAETVARAAEVPGMPIAGSLTTLWTSFDVTGTPDSVASALSRIAAVLRRQGDAERAAASRAIAHAEPLPPAGAFALSLRRIFGAVNFGLVGFPEFGLSTATPEGLWALAASRFTAANAVLCVEGTPPSGLSLELPSGPWRQPVPRAVATNPPGVFLGDQPEVLAAAVLPDAPATRLMVQLLAAGVRRHAPVDSWQAFETTALLESLGGDLLAGVAVTAPGPYAAVACDAIVAALDELCATDVPIPIAVQHAPAVGSVDRVWEAAEEFLLGTRAGAARASGPGSIRAAAQSFREGLYLGLPADVDPRDLRVAIPDPGPDAPVPGDPLPRAFGYGDGFDASLTVGDTGISVSDIVGRLTIPWTEVVGCLIGEGELRILVRRDGKTLDIDAVHWRHGRRVVERIDRSVPADVRIPWAVRRAVEPRGFFDRVARDARWPRSVASHLLINVGIVVGTLSLAFVSLVLFAGTVGASGPEPLNAVFGVALGAVLCVVLIHSLLALWGLVSYLRRRLRHSNPGRNVLPGGRAAGTADRAREAAPR
jgi:hypothetical protein